MEKLFAFIRQNITACIIGVAVLGFYGYFTITGRECFNCKQTESYKSGQPRNNTSGLRFRHK